VFDAKAFPSPGQRLHWDRGHPARIRDACTAVRAGCPRSQWSRGSVL